MKPLSPTWNWVALPLQIAGFVAALLALIFFNHDPSVFVAAFIVHFIGDVIFFFEGTTTGVPMGNFFSNIGKYLILPTWLQFVGVVVVFGSLMAVHGPARWVGFTGLGVACAGRLYNVIYPS